MANANLNRINALLADMNGSAFAIPGTGEWGYIPTQWKIAIPNGLAVAANFAIGTSPWTDGNANMQHAFISANFQTVRGVVNTDEEALFVAMIRFAIATEGTLCTDLNNRGVVEDEYFVMNAPTGAWNANQNDIPNNANATNIAKYVKKYYKTIVHQMVYMFLSRGHHYTNDYVPIYRRLSDACLMPANPGFTLPSPEVIYRLAIHGFGIKPLLNMTIAHYTAGEMLAAMRLRFSPHAPIAGVAHITTLAAVLKEMSSEPWYAAFSLKFAAEITAIHNEVAAIRANPYDYHVAHRVLGSNMKRSPQPVTDAAFVRLSQFVIGYIDHLGRRHSLSGQIAITRKANGAKPLADAFAKACDNFGKPSTAVVDMTAFLAQV